MPHQALAEDGMSPVERAAKAYGECEVERAANSVRMAELVKEIERRRARANELMNESIRLEKSLKAAAVEAVEAVQ